jgi:CRP-like cAMP-binding protein
MKTMSSQLRNNERFAALSTERLDVLTSLSEVVSLPAAETFVHEGQTSHEFYYIEEGRSRSAIGKAATFAILAGPFALSVGLATGVDPWRSR